MNKKLVLLLFTILLLSGCGKKQVRKCSLNQDQYMSQEIEFIAKDNNNIDQLKIRIIFAKELIDANELNELTDEQKQSLEKSILDNMDLSKDNMEGINFSVDINDTVDFILDIDVDKADPTLLKTLGLDLSDKDTSLDKVISSLKENGATCE